MPSIRDLFSVILLTQNVCRLGSRYLLLPIGKTRTTLRLSISAVHKAVYALLDKFKKPPNGSFLKMPSTGIEPVAFPMSRAHRPLTGKFLVEKLALRLPFFTIVKILPIEVIEQSILRTNL